MSSPPLEVKVADFMKFQASVGFLLVRAVDPYSLASRLILLLTLCLAILRSASSIGVGCFCTCLAKLTVTFMASNSDQVM